MVLSHQLNKEYNGHTLLDIADYLSDKRTEKFIVPSEPDVLSGSLFFLKITFGRSIITNPLKNLKPKDIMQVSRRSDQHVLSKLRKRNQ